MSGVVFSTNGQRFATRMDGTLYYVHQDHLGSTVAVSDAAGQAVGRVQYDPYGEVLASSLPVTLTERLFTGARFDGTIGLYQMGARWYDPALGRWIQPDALVPDPLSPQAWNRFSYVYNNPTTFNDPSGHLIPAAVAVPLLFIAGGALVGELAYAGHLYYTGEQANAADLLTWMSWGAFAGATVYMAPYMVGYGLSLAGMDVIGTAVWLSRLGVPAASLYRLMNIGQSAYEAGYFLQFAGWAGVRGLAGLGKPYGGRSPEVFRQLIEGSPHGAFRVDDEFLELLEQMYSLPEGSWRGATLAPDTSGIIEVIVRSDYDYADVGHEYVHFQQFQGIGASPYYRPAAELEACGWEFRTAAEVGDFQWFREAWIKVQYWLQVLGSQ